MPRQKKQEAIPSQCLRKAIKIGQAIVENNAGKPIDRLTLAEVLGYSPKSSGFILLVVSSNLYGITCYDEDKIALDKIGQSYFYPQSDDEPKQAILAAAQNLPLLSRLYKHFDNNQLPTNDIAQNILKRSFQVPDNKTESLWRLFLDDTQFIGAIQQIKGKQYINLSRIGLQAPEMEEIEVTGEEDIVKQGEGALAGELITPTRPSAMLEKLKVFISHGKNKNILDQIKTTVEYGNLEPVIVVHEETTAIPVSEKILEAMHKCHAGIINVSADEVIKTEEGEEQYKINENVLIEIGAAFVLYKKKVILVVDKRITLPSNLQGLYLCYYEGDSLDWNSGMKLQEALLKFKK
ncbi:MAG: nucleotide-binding protein [Candidatus Marinimicrobia bacterium]|nr:nucleotide-binding protein [Candidatus Neomarinimicrobiota bacterium]